MPFGRNRGCSFFNLGCYAPSPSPEFCNDQYLGCSSDTKSTSKCMSTSFSNKCKMRMLYQSCTAPRTGGQVFETMSAESQCHRYKNLNGTTAGCVKTECDYEKMQYWLVKDDSTYSFRFLCEYKNQEHLIPNFGFTLLCEDPKLICTRKLDCPRNCNGRGICMDSGKCLCNTFYEGDLCGRYVGCGQSGQSICSQVLAATPLDTTTLSNDFAGALEEMKHAQATLEGRANGSRARGRLHRGRF